MERKFIEVNGVKIYKYKAVLVSEDGHVYNQAMKEKIPLKDHCLWIYDTNLAERNKDGSRKRKKYKINRIVYEAVTGETLSPKYRIINIDGNLDNYAFTNLKKVSIEDIMRQRDFTMQYKISEEDRKVIRKSLEPDKVLAKKYGVSTVTIQKIRANGVGRNWYKE